MSTHQARVRHLQPSAAAARHRDLSGLPRPPDHPCPRGPAHRAVRPHRDQRRGQAPGSQRRPPPRHRRPRPRHPDPADLRHPHRAPRLRRVRRHRTRPRRRPRTVRRLPGRLVGPDRHADRRRHAVHPRPAARPRPGRRPRQRPRQRDARRRTHLRRQLHAHHPRRGPRRTREAVRGRRPGPRTAPPVDHVPPGAAERVAAPHRAGVHRARHGPAHRGDPELPRRRRRHHRGELGRHARRVPPACRRAPAARDPARRRDHPERPGLQPVGGRVEGRRVAPVGGGDPARQVQGPRRDDRPGGARGPHRHRPGRPDRPRAG